MEPEISTIIMAPYCRTRQATSTPMRNATLPHWPWKAQKIPTRKMNSMKIPTTKADRFVMILPSTQKTPSR